MSGDRDAKVQLVRDMCTNGYFSPHGIFNPSLALSALDLALGPDAALVACVDPSPSESGSTDPEVRQSADRTSSPSRVPGEET